MKATLIFTFGLVWVGAAMGSRCRPSKPSSSISVASSSVSSSPTASPSCSGNFISDGTFTENKLSPSWVVDGEAEINPNCYAHSVSCAHLQTGSTFTSITQTVTTTPNTVYDINFAYQILSQSKNPTITVTVDGIVLETIQLNTQTDNIWIQSPVVQFTATGAQTTVSFAVNAVVTGGNGVIQIANIGMCGY